jgi:uncharacterized protein (DUF4415 family)
MAKRSSGSSVRGKRARKSATPIPDHDIDFSDIPELSDRQLKSMRRVGRPVLGKSPRKAIAIRLDPEVLDWLKAEAARTGKRYQSLINEILAKHTRKKSAA